MEFLGNKNRIMIHFKNNLKLFLQLMSKRIVVEIIVGQYTWHDFPPFFLGDHEKTRI